MFSPALTSFRFFELFQVIKNKDALVEFMEDLFGEDFTRYEYQSLEEAEEVLEQEFGRFTQAREIFYALEDEEMTCSELSDETGIQENSIRSQITKLKREGLAYALGPSGTKFYGLNVDEVHEDGYERIN